MVRNFIGIIHTIQQIVENNTILSEMFAEFGGDPCWMKNHPNEISHVREMQFWKFTIDVYFAVVLFDRHFGRAHTFSMVQYRNIIEKKWSWKKICGIATNVRVRYISSPISSIVRLLFYRLFICVAGFSKCAIRILIIEHVMTSYEVKKMHVVNCNDTGDRFVSEEFFGSD